MEVMTDIYVHGKEIWVNHNRPWGPQSCTECDDANATINSDWDTGLYFYPSDKVLSWKITHNTVNAAFCA